MNEVWFSPQAAYAFSALGLLSLTGLAAPWMIKGRHRAIVVWLWRAIVAAGLLMLGAGALAAHQAQPAHVVWPLVTAGAVVALGFSLSLYFVQRIYRQAEQRKVAAREL